VVQTKAMAMIAKKNNALFLDSAMSALASGMVAVAWGGGGRCGVRRRRRSTEAPERRYGTRRLPLQLQADSPPGRPKKNITNQCFY